MIKIMYLKRFFILLRWPITFVSAEIHALPNCPSPQPHQSISRVFEGRLEKTNAFLALFSKWTYSLYDKDTRIAYLEFKENVRTPKIADLFIHKNIIVRGSPVYINKEPYLLIIVDDMCEK